MWPFQSIDATPYDIADAISPAYQTWRLSPGLPICDSPKAFGDRKATILSLPATGSRLIPLSRQLPVTGPYQIVLPAWIDTDNLFLVEVTAFSKPSTTKSSSHTWRSLGTKRKRADNLETNLRDIRW